jgi:nucleotidyltransferase substrate binding protein (TIGR01987 family)
METLNLKYQQLIKALTTLEKSLEIVQLCIKEQKSYNPYMDFEDEYRGHRDSAVQRFEYCTDLFWKYIKKHLEKKLINIRLGSPAETIREAFSAQIINEVETERILRMIKDRNQTSHIYMEEIAEILIKKIPEYFETMKNVSQRVESF